MNAPLIKRIDLKYNNLRHSALVNMNGTPEKMLIHVQLINSFLQKIVGMEHIRFLNRNGQIQPKEGKHPAVSFISDFIIKELEQFSGIETPSALSVV